MNFIKVLVLTVVVFALALVAAPMVLGTYILASAARTPQGAAAITGAAALSDKDVQRKIIEHAIARDTEALSRPNGSVVVTDYSRHEPVETRPAPVPGEPMLDPKPTR